MSFKARCCDLFVDHFRLLLNSCLPLKVKVLFRDKVDLSPGKKKTDTCNNNDCDMNSNKVIWGRKIAFLFETKLWVSFKGAFYISEWLKRVVDIDIPMKAILKLSFLVSWNEGLDSLNCEIHILYLLQKGFEGWNIVSTNSKNFLHIILKSFTISFNNHFSLVFVIYLCVKYFQSVSCVTYIRILKKSLVKVLSVVNHWEKGIWKIS